MADEGFNLGTMDPEVLKRWRALQGIPEPTVNTVASSSVKPKTGIVQEDPATVAANQAKIDAAERARELANGPTLKYNPVTQDIKTGTIGLRKELQQQGATSSGLTQRLLDQQAQSEMFGRDDAASRAMQASDQARAAASMRGGNRSGNTALMQRQSLRDQLMAQQDVSKQAMGNRFEIQSKGAAQDLAAINANANQLGTAITGVNQFNLEKYKTDAAKAAAKENADATRNSGK